MDRDPGLERLLDLDGFVAELGGGFWVKVDAVRVPSDPRRPYGVAYSLSLHAPDGLRVFGIGNAHPARVTGGPAGRSSASRDHMHAGARVRSYRYRDADTLLDDFWREVRNLLGKEGIE